MAEEPDRIAPASDALASPVNFNPVDFQAGAPSFSTEDLQSSQGQELQSLGFPAAASLLKAADTSKSPAENQPNQSENQRDQTENQLLPDAGGRNTESEATEAVAETETETLDDGTKIENFRNDNGDFISRLTNPNGSTRTITSRADGFKDDERTEIDGSRSLTTTRPDGSTKRIAVDPQGTIESFDSLSQRGFRSERGPDGQRRVIPLTGS